MPMLRTKFTFAMTAADDATKAAISGNLITGSSMSADNGYVEKTQTKEGLKDGEHYKLDFSSSPLTSRARISLLSTSWSRMAVSASGRMMRTPIP